MKIYMTTTQGLIFYYNPNWYMAYLENGALLPRAPWEIELALKNKEIFYIGEL